MLLDQSGEEWSKRPDEREKLDLKAIEREKDEIATTKAKLEVDLAAVRKEVAVMQKQLDALKAADIELQSGRGLRKPQHRQKFQVLSMDKNHVWHQMLNHSAMGKNQNPLLIVEGFGNRVWDANGKEYLDATSGGTWTVNVGYGRTEIADAVQAQISKMQYFSLQAANIPAAQVCVRLRKSMRLLHAACNVSY